MKQLLSLFLFLLPCLAWAQYPSNGNQKITLGEQTTADGLIFRGVLADTGIITPLSDTSAYIILDTVNHRFYNYNRATNVWSVAGGGTAVTTFSAGTTGLTPSTATSGAVTLAGTLAVANGGTGSATQNFVDLSTTQTSIGGAKTFTSALIAASNVKIHRGLADDSESVAIGNLSLNSTTTGIKNTAIGERALQSMKTGQRNFAMGQFANYLDTAGSFNAAIGWGSLGQNLSGSNNVGVGYITLYENTNGSSNTAVGYKAAGQLTNSNTTGSNNTFIGNEAVGASATASNVITLGNSSIATIRAQVTGITGFSDIRDKTNIMPLNYGIDFIKKLNPVSFDWDMRDGGKIGISEIGFIAQELQQAQIDSQINIPNLVYDINPDKLEASYGVLIPIIVKALKEQQALIDELKQRILNLENK
jgi:hypothetical protein